MPANFVRLTPLAAAGQPAIGWVDLGSIEQIMAYSVSGYSGSAVLLTSGAQMVVAESPEDIFALMDRASHQVLTEQAGHMAEVAQEKHDEHYHRGNVSTAPIPRG